MQAAQVAEERTQRLFPIERVVLDPYIQWNTHTHTHNHIATLGIRSEQAGNESSSDTSEQQ